MATLDQILNLTNYTRELNGKTLTLSGTDKWMLVVIHLLNQRNQRTSFNSLARWSGFTPGTCIRSIFRLLRLHLIERQRNFTDDDETSLCHQSNTYTILVGME